MTYEEAINYIDSTHRFGSQPGLERIEKLCSLIGNPQDDLRFVHIAGTNGKGSTSKAVAAALTQAGARTGLYISPYVSDFCERIEVDGRNIPHEDLAKEVECIAPYVKEAADAGFQTTEFELITVVAFDYFRRRGCDVVVLEVGLGGRFDATNIIKKPLCSVITSIDLDHCEILGDTLGKIAFEKCGIIKEGGVTVSSPGQHPEALEVIRRVCSERGNSLQIPNLGSARIIKESIDGTDLEYGGKRFHIPLCGRHQIKNFLTAREALKTLDSSGLAVSDGDIAEGFSKVKFISRLEVLCRSPLVLLDGAHNPAGAAALADAIKNYLDKKPVIIMGMLADKNYAEAIAALAPLCRAFVAVKPDSPRALEAEVTAREAAKHCGPVICCDDYTEAFLRARSLAGAGPVVICGSLYLAGGMRRAVLGALKKAPVR